MRPWLARGLVAAALIPGIATAGPAGTRALQPYRVFANTPGARRLLAEARETIERQGSETPDGADAGDPARAARPGMPLPWPGAPVTVFLSLARGTTTRACVGRAAAAATLGEAVASLAAEVRTADPRRPPVRAGELKRLRVVIAFAAEGESVADPMIVDPARDGLSVSTARGTVAFLPGEARTVAWALREARRIGVLDPAAGPPTYRRFPVVAISEPQPQVEDPADDPTP